MDKCKIHNIELECLAGCSAHPSNWYCPKCADLEDRLREIALASLSASNTKDEVDNG